MKIVAFNQPWYAEKIQETLQHMDSAGASPDACAIAHGILVAGAMISESIERGLMNEDASLAHELSYLGAALDHVAEVVKEVAEPK